MKLNPNSKNAIKQFKHIRHLSISENQDDGFLDLFLLPINARKFDCHSVSDNLRESVADYALSWKIRDKYKDKAMIISMKAREKFKKAENNNGELGELLLFCFLEGHLNAPKILTKLELKTASQIYINGSDGVHLKKLSDKKYQLIFGESKTYKDLKKAFTNAFKSIGEFINEVNASGNGKSGIHFEKGLISSNIDSDIFEKDEEENLNALLYPEKKGDYKFSLDDAFSIFIGYEIDIKDEQRKCSNDEFPIEIERKTVNQIESYKDNVYKLIKKYDLVGYTFYVFIMPFANIDKDRKEILGEILK